MGDDKINIKVKADVKNAVKGLNQTEKEINDVKKAEKGIGKAMKIGIGAGVAALALLTVAVKKTVGAFIIQEKAQKTLAAAMKQAGTFTEAALEHNIAYAASLQKMTTFGDEAILGVQRQLTNFGAEGEMLDQLTKATLDLAAAKGMDLKSAGDLVAKSFGSSTNAMSRYGIEVEGAAGSTERAESAVKNMTKLFGGAAAAEAATFGGQIQQMSNNFGDLMEVIGGGVAGALKPFFGVISKGISVISNLFTKQDDVLGVTTDLIKATKRLAVARKKLEEDTGDLTEAEKALFKSQSSFEIAKISTQLLELSKAYSKLNDEQKILDTTGSSAIDSLALATAAAQRDVDEATVILNKWLEGSTDEFERKQRLARQKGGRFAKPEQQFRSQVGAQEHLLKASKRLTAFTKEEIDVKKKQEDEIKEVAEAYNLELVTIGQLNTIHPKLKKRILETAEALKKVKDAGKGKPTGGGDDGDLAKRLAEEKALRDKALQSRLDAEKKIADQIAAYELSRKNFVIAEMTALYQGFFGIISQVSNASLDNDLTVMSARRDEELASLDEKDAERETENIDKQIADAKKIGDEKLVNELIAKKADVALETKTQAEKDAINEKYDKKERERKTRTGLLDQALGFASAMISAVVTSIKAGESMANIPVVGPILAAVAQGVTLATMTGVALKAKNQPIPKFAEGGSITTNGPQMVMVGDNPSGVERVDFTPLDDDTGPGGNTYIFNGIQDLAEARNELMRQEGGAAWQL
jgi:hypothetical protein